MTAPMPPIELGEPLAYEDARQGLSTLARHRRDARQHLEQAHANLADKERDYRKAKATAYVEVKASETDKPISAGERDARVDAATADLRFARDVAKGMLKSAEERMAEIDAERASLHRLADWSSKLPAGAEPADFDAAAQRLRDRVPPREAA